MTRGIITVLCSASALFAMSVNAQAQTITGPAEVVDGNTLDMTGAHIRLFGIDAPEGAQTCNRGGKAWDCGQNAAATLSQFVSGKQIECTVRAPDDYGRLIAVCTADGLDLAKIMVERGMAVALSRDGSPYLETEAIAKHFKLGIWNTEFLAPAEWRAAHPSNIPKAKVSGTATASAPRRQQVYRNQFGCSIKGNRNRRGNWIYHLPGMTYYDRTRPEELFCTEAEARAAGYRRSKV